MKQKILTLLLMFFMLGTVFSMDAEATELEEIPLLEQVEVFEDKAAFAATVVNEQKVTDYFVDVVEDQWFVNSVQYVFDKELMSGSGEYFNPTQNVTRAQLVTTIYRLAGSPEVTDYSACELFSDVAEGKYYTDPVCWAYNEGIATGNDGKFNTTGNLTRQQMVTFLFRFAKVMRYDVSCRADFSEMLNEEKVSEYARIAMSWAVGAGLISGSQTKGDAGNVAYDLNPRGNTTRAQTATILQRFCEEIQNTEYTPWIYEKNEDGTLLITGHELGQELSGNVIIPSEINGKKVTAIGEKAFFASNIETIEMHDDITYIGKSAFERCIYLKNVKIPSDIKVLEAYVFADCSQLESVELPEGLLRIGDYAFFWCEELKTANIPATVETIGNGAFWCCSKLEGVVLPQGLTKIGEYAFCNNWKLEKVEIPKGITKIEKAAFYGCSNLIEVSLPEGLLSIGYDAFGDCWDLYEIEIPSTVQSIGEYAFSNKECLRKIKFLGDAPQIHNDAFLNVKSKVYYSKENEGWNEDILQSYGGELTWIPMLESSQIEQQTWFYVENEDGTIELLEYLGKEPLVILSVPTEVDGKQVTSIGVGCFADMESLEKITIPKEILNIESGAFSGCTNLKTLNILSELEILNQEVFAECTSLETISIPESVTKIEKGAFRECGNLQSIVIPNNVTNIEERAFFDCYGLQSVELSDKLQKIGPEAFRNCCNLEMIDIPGTVEVIDDEIFAGCTNMKKVIINEGTTTVWKYSFSKCTSLSEVILPNTVTIIGVGMFSECISLKQITIPESVTLIADRAFRKCTSLTEISIPKNVEVLGNASFSGCTDLKKIVFEGNAPLRNGGIVEPAFLNVEAEVYYQAKDENWTEEAILRLAENNTNLTWIPYENQ